MLPLEFGHAHGGLGVGGERFGRAGARDLVALLEHCGSDEALALGRRLARVRPGPTAHGGCVLRQIRRRPQPRELEELTDQRHIGRDRLGQSVGGRRAQDGADVRTVAVGERRNVGAQSTLRVRHLHLDGQHIIVGRGSRNRSTFREEVATHPIHLLLLDTEKVADLGDGKVHTVFLVSRRRHRPEGGLECVSLLRIHRELHGQGEDVGGLGRAAVLPHGALRIVYRHIRLDRSERGLLDHQLAREQDKDSRGEHHFSLRVGESVR